MPDHAKIVADAVAEIWPLLGQNTFEKIQNGHGELIIGLVKFIMCDIFVYDAP